MGTADTLVIDVPPKIWRPKQKNYFQPQETLHDVDEGVFMFEKLGKCVFKLSEQWKDSERDDVIEFNPEKDEEELQKNFKIGTTVEPKVKERITELIKKYWDCFCSEGARRPILGYEFSINTGTHTPVCK